LAQPYPQSSRSAVWIENSALIVRDVPVPALEPDEVLVRIGAAGICGSDLHAFRMEVPRRRMAGIGPGHEIAGEVIAVGEGVAGPVPGTRVAVFGGKVCKTCAFCRGGRPQLCGKIRLAGQNYPGGMAEYFVAQDGMVCPLPDTVDWPLAALCEPLAICLHGLKKVGRLRGRRVLVLGAGTIGLLAALVALDAGAEAVAITARYHHQAAAARALGVHEIYDPEEIARGAPASRLDWDVVVEAVGGNAPTLQQAIDVAARGATVLLIGAHHAAQPILTTRVFRHELTIVGSFGCNYLGPRSDFEASLALIETYRDRLAPLVTHTFPLHDVSAAFAAALDKRSGAIKVSVLP
jgi:2-desacetyl-2-hydroxyethyl bacteriochlorophyllide A dehydrogenase